MWSSKTKKLGIIVTLALMLLAALLVRHFSGNLDATARGQFLRFVPADATSVIFVDLDELRSSPFLAKLYAWAPHPAEDSDYAQFVRDTGFNYERDLGKAFIAVSDHGTATNLLILAEGKFDRKKIEAFLSRTGKVSSQGNLKVFLLPASLHDKPLSMAFLSDQRIALTNSENLFAALSSAVHEAGHAEWQTRFGRLAGAPAFAVIRQDSALQAALDSASPGGFRSPQLSALLNQLQWISLAGKPDGDLLRLVAEGECPSDLASSQLRDFLQGIQLLAQNGLNDPKLRQQMNPDERDAYLQLLKSADIAKIDRGDSKSVRLVLTVTPQFLDTVRSASLTPPAPQIAAPQTAHSAPRHKGSTPKKK